MPARIRPFLCVCRSDVGKTSCKVCVRLGPVRPMGRKTAEGAKDREAPRRRAITARPGFLLALTRGSSIVPGVVSGGRRAYATNAGCGSRSWSDLGKAVIRPAVDARAHDGQPAATGCGQHLALVDFGRGKGARPEVRKNTGRIARAARDTGRQSLLGLRVGRGLAALG